MKTDSRFVVILFCLVVYILARLDGLLGFPRRHVVDQRKGKKGRMNQIKEAGHGII